MKVRDSHHFHHILGIAPGPMVEIALAAGRPVRVTGAIEHTHPVDANQFGGRHFHSSPGGPNGEPLGYSARSLVDVEPEGLKPSDKAAVRVWDDRLRH